MNFAITSSPHHTQHQPLRLLMAQVLLAGVPGLLLMTAYFGWGVLINVLLAMLMAQLTEAAVLRLRQKPVKETLRDNSALVTGFLYGLTLPALLPWWATCIGIIFAIAVVKHLYGGIGSNPFNPAMAGYVLLIVAFPGEMTLNWTVPSGIESPSMSFWSTLTVIFMGEMPDGTAVQALRGTIDAVTHATPLDSLKTQLSQNLMASEITDSPIFGQFGGLGWEWVNLAFFLGGLYLVVTKVADWRIPLAFTVSLFTTAMFFNAVSPERYIDPMFHMVTGGTMLGAFFIATDPVTASTTPSGRYIYAALIGFTVYIIRTFGNYPDGIAFAVLIMNMLVPALDYYTKPRAYGHRSEH